MTREEWYAFIESAPATGNQRGRIMAEFERLGVASRAQRLTICSDCDALTSADS